MTDCSIRGVEDDDLARITAIYGHHVRFGSASFEIDPPSLGEMAERLRALRAGRYPFLVCEVGGTVSGYAYAGPYRLRPAYRYTVEDSVYLDPACMGRGIGRKLLERLIREATGQGFRQMIAVIGDSANLPSIRLHEAAGFVHAGTLRSSGFKFGRWLDSVLMQRPLGKGDRSAPAS